MIETLNAPPHVAAFRLSGRIEADDYDTVVPLIESRLEEFERIGTFIDITGMEGMSVGALGEDLRYSLSKLGEMGRFERSAVVATAEWPEAIAGFAERFMPGVEIRVVDPADAEEALDWVAGVRVEQRA